MVTFFSPEGLFVLLIAGLLCGALSGVALATTLKEQARVWLATATRDPQAMKSIELVLPFVGMACGACAFLGATLQNFTFSVGLSFALAVPVTVGGEIATRWQYSVILRQIQRGGGDRSRIVPVTFESCPWSLRNGANFGANFK